MATPPLHLVLELARTEDADDPHAFRFERQAYTLRTEGGGRELVEVPWGDRLSADLEAIRLPGRDPAVVARVGEALRKVLQPAGWKAIAGRIAAATEEGRRVIVTLRANAAELYALPWELTTLTRGGDHLGALPQVLLRYEWPETETARPPKRPRPAGGRVVFAWSAAGGRVPARAHQAAIAAACRAGYLEFDPERDVVAHASVEAIARVLDADGEPVVALHVLAHGAEAGSTYGLALDAAEAGERVVVDAGHLRRQLGRFAGRLRLVVLAACDGGNAGPAGNHLGSVAQGLHRAGVGAVIASRYPFSVMGSIAMTEALYGALLEGPGSLEAAVLAARARLAADPEHLDWASLQLQARAGDGDDTRPFVFRPYRGLLAFQPRHARFFFGRDAERAETLGDLAALTEAGQPRFLVVAGASGTGKSSMVLAGAVPDLVRRAADRGPTSDADLRRAIELLRGLPASQDTPMVRQARDLLAAADRLSVAGDWQAEIIRPGADPEAALAPFLATLTPGSKDRLLVVDQFEEVFTQTVDPAARGAFARTLWSLARAPDSGVSVIITIRVDFLGRCGELVLDEAGLRLDKVAYDEAHRVFVAQMGAAQLRSAIEGPAEKVGLQLEAGLADRMLADVEGEPGALPLLSYTLDLLWQQREGRLLTQAAYDALGGVTGALHGKADALVDALSEARQFQARRLLVRLVGVSADGATDTRRRVELATLRPGRPAQAEAFDAVLAALVDARLLVRSEVDGAATVEVAHEALIRRWPRLRDWLHADQEMLTQVAEVEAWVAHWKGYGTLLQGDQLGYATRIRDKFPEDLSDAAVELIEASEADRAARARRSRRRLVFAASAAGIIAIVMAGLALWGMRSSTLATRARQDAEEESLRAKAKEREARASSRRAQAALITSMAQSLQGTAPLAASLVLVELQSQGLVETAPAAARGLAVRLRQQPVPRAVIQDPDRGTAEGASPTLGFAADGTLVVFSPTPPTLQCYDADGLGAKCPEACPGHGAPVRVRFASAAPVAVATDAEGRLCRLGAGDPPQALGSAQEDFGVLAVSAAGAFVVVHRPNDTIERVRTRDGVAQPLDRQSPFGDWAVSDQGAVVVVSSERLWAQRPPAAAIERPGHGVEGCPATGCLVSMHPDESLAAGLDHPVFATTADGVAEWAPGAEGPPRHCPDCVGDVVRRHGEATRRLRLHTSPLEVELIEGDGEPISLSLAPGLAERQGVHACRPLQGPAVGFVCENLALYVHGPPLALPRRAGRVDVLAAAVSPDSARIAALYDDGTITLTPTLADSAISVNGDHAPGRALRRIRPDGSAVFHLDQDGTLRAWSLPDREARPPLTEVLAVDRTRWRALRLVDGSGTLVPIDGGTATPLSGTLTWTEARFDPSGRYVAGRDAGGRLSLRDLADGGRAIDSLGVVSLWAFAPASGRLALVDGEGRLRLFANGRARPVEGPVKLTEVAWAGDGGSLLVTDGAKGLWRVDAEAGVARRLAPVDRTTQIRHLRLSKTGAVGAWIAQVEFPGLPQGVHLGPEESDPIADVGVRPVEEEEEMLDLPGMPGEMGDLHVIHLHGEAPEARALTKTDTTEFIIIEAREGEHWILPLNGRSAVNKPFVLDALDPGRRVELSGEPPITADFQGGLLATRTGIGLEVWDPFGAGLVARFSTDGCPATVELSPRGDLLVIGGQQCALVAWRLDLADALRALRARTAVCLTADQRRRLLAETPAESERLAAACQAAQRPR